jgi:hypothetical protein
VSTLRLLLVAVLLAGCALVDGRQRFEIVLPGELDWPPPLPVVVEDRTGLVHEIGQPALAGDFHFPTGVINMPGRLDELAVNWTSGACTVGSTILFEGSTPEGYQLSVRTRDQHGPNPCPAIGFGRTLVLHLKAPVDAAAVRFEESVD